MSGKIIVIGAGHMGSAILRGLMHGRQQTLHVFDTQSERLHEWREQGIACSETPPQPAAQDTLVLAIPPQVFPSFACANLALHGHRGLVISVMAGVRMQVISKVLNTPAVVRAIPNTPSEVMEGMSVCCALPTVEPTRMEQAMRLLETCGKVIRVDSESLLDPATELCGGGPAFIAYIADAMQSYAADAGFSGSQAQQMTSQVLRGTAALIEASGKEFSVICHEVMTPGGTTERGIDCFRQYSLRDIIRAAMSLSQIRPNELGMQLSALPQKEPL